jgi:5'-phosphate synthase pdxT subunit
VKIGILAVQGDFAAHAAILQQLGAETVEVRTPADLEGCNGLVLPGGESTTQLKFLQEEGLAGRIVKFAEQGGAIFGTCAGAILLAKDVRHPKQESLNLMDMTVVRNGYGRQIASDVVSGPTTLKKDPLEMVFIRGPVIERAGPGVKVLAEYAGKPALVQRENILAATFHPELTEDTTVHQYFLRLAGTAGKQPSNGHKPASARKNGREKKRLTERTAK